MNVLAILLFSEYLGTGPAWTDAEATLRDSEVRLAQAAAAGDHQQLQILVAVEFHGRSAFESWRSLPVVVSEVATRCFVLPDARNPVQSGSRCWTAAVESKWTAVDTRGRRRVHRYLDIWVPRDGSWSIAARHELVQGEASVSSATPSNDEMQQTSHG